MNEATEHVQLGPGRGSVPVVEVSRERLNLSELVRLMLAAQSSSSTDRSAVRLTRNARGDTQIEVLVREGDAGAEGIAGTAEKAREVYDALREQYPLASAEPAGEVS